MESFSWAGENLATLGIVGKTYVEKEILNISANLVEISFLSSFNILVGMLFGSTDLFEFREDIIFCTSYSLVGLRKKEFWFLSYRKLEKYLCE